MKDLKTVCADKLVALNNNITAKEKEEAVKGLGISRPTLDKYLKGDVPKIGTATVLIKHFTVKVNERIKELNKT
jgi:predicted DNA-binding protein (UPF0251 family)